jgi:hypothetical protein
MIRPAEDCYDPQSSCIGIAHMDGVEELEALIAERRKKLSPCPCCGRPNPKIAYSYNGSFGRDDKHQFRIYCPGNAMHVHSHPNNDGCGLGSGMLMAKEDEDYADFKEALRYLTEAWNRRS